MPYYRLVSLAVLGVASLALWFGIPSVRREPSVDGSHYRSEIVATLGDLRLTSGRLRGFPFRPGGSKPVAVRSGDPALSQMGREVEKELRTEPSSRSRADMALLNLADGKPERAVELLEAATSVKSPEKPGFLNDLAVAYLARSEALGQPRDLTRALDVATLATERDPTLSEACFNRALALERLQLTIEATRAWENCAYRERDPGWKGEMKRHLAGLQQASKPADLERALHRGNEPLLEATLAADLEAARSEALDRILPSWAEAYLNGLRAEADEAVARGQAFGRILAELDHDSTVAEVFDGIAGESSWPSSRTRLTALAHAVELYKDARKAFASDKVLESRKLFEQARSLFSDAGSPLKFWADLGVIGCDVYEDEFDEALKRLHVLRPSIDGKRFPTLAARWHWINGMAHSRQGDLRASLRDFEATVSYYEKTGERENQGAAYQLVGEMYRLLGDEGEAWQYRMRGLNLLRETLYSKRRLMLLRDAGESLLVEGRSRAALAFQNEAVQIASSNARDFAEMLLWRARALTQLGDFGAAWSDLQRARIQAAKIESQKLRERSIADIGFAEADLESQRNPEHALPLFEAPALAYETKGHVLALATLLLHRARLARTLHLPDTELADLTAGIELFERQWQSLDTEKDRVSFLETAQELYDARIVLEIERADPRTALEFSERSRAFWAGSPGAVDASWVRSIAVAPQGMGRCLEDRRGALPKDVVVLEYALAGDRLFLWLLRCDGLRFVTLPVSAVQVEELAKTFRDTAQIGPSEPERFRKVADRAYDILFRKVASDIPAGAMLVIVPDKALHGIPFAALRDRTSSRFLIEDHEITVAPSATFLKATLHHRIAPIGPADALLVSPLDPELKDSGEEIKDLHRLYPDAQVLVGPAASKDALLDALDQQRMLHYAGHAEVHPSNPFLSRLPLSSAAGSEAVTVLDLQGRSFEHLELVVLSACGSVAPTPSRTGGFLGLARPFLSGGVHSVVGTLWDIKDATSRAVLVAFHRKLRTGSSAVSALRAAQLEFLHEGWPPSVWASFAIVGNGD